MSILRDYLSKLYAEQAQYHAVTVGDYEWFSLTAVYISVSAHRLWIRCSRVPDRWRFECECPPTLEAGCALRGNQTTSIGLLLPIQVTPSPVTVTVTEAPVAQPTQRLRLGWGEEYWRLATP